MEYGDIIFKTLKRSTKEEKVEICKALRIPFTGDIYTISKEYRSAAGYSFTNIFRKDHVLPYKRILIDVADKLKPGFRWTSYKLDDDTPEKKIEDDIMRYLSERAQQKGHALTQSEKKKKEEQLIQELMKTGLLVGALGGPAYRKTILATILMIRIRRRMEAEALL